MAQGIRTLRVAEAIQREVASTLLLEARDPLLRYVTVTAVHVSPDLRNARVLYVSGKAARAEVEKKLPRILGLVQKRVGENVSLRYAPRVSFAYDEGYEEGARVGAILQEIRASGRLGDATEDAGTAAEPGPDHEGGEGGG